jgi:hypothetical protein
MDKRTGLLCDDKLTTLTQSKEVREKVGFKLRAVKFLKQGCQIRITAKTQNILAEYFSAFIHCLDTCRMIPQGKQLLLGSTAEIT